MEENQVGNCRIGFPSFLDRQPERVASRASTTLLDVGRYFAVCSESFEQDTIYEVDIDAGLSMYNTIHRAQERVCEAGKARNESDARQGYRVKMCMIARDGWISEAVK